MSDPVVAVVMLGIFVLTILLGFPICFTLMAMGVAFGFYAYYDAERMRSIFDNQIFDLLVNQTYSVMANDGAHRGAPVPVHGLHRRAARTS